MTGQDRFRMLVRSFVSHPVQIGGVGSAVLLGVLGHVSPKYHPRGAHAEGPWPCNVVASVKYVKRKASECCGP